jgi:hypothetical protein
MGEHIMAFKTYSQWNDWVNGSAADKLPAQENKVSDTIKPIGSSFKISEQHHDTKVVLQHQTVLR